MGKAQKKRKAKTFAEQLGSLFQGTKEAKGDTPNRGMSGDKPSIAERINFGGKGEQLKRDRLKNRRRK